MKRNYSNIAFDPASAHYVGASTIPTPFQAYDEEGEIQLGPEGETDCFGATQLVTRNPGADGIGENLIPPINERSSLELFSQGSDPWRVIDG
jgi:cleavage and polyadenylation specificity factor subunit 1